MPATAEEIGAILRSPNFDESDKWVVKWQFRMLGSFETALSQAIKQADDDNLTLLALGFPVQVEGYRRWTRDGLGRRLRAAGLDI
jgi:hypothetical protein